MARALSHTQSKYQVLYQRIANAIQDGRFHRYTKQKQHRLRAEQVKFVKQ